RSRKTRSSSTSSPSRRSCEGPPGERLAGLLDEDRERGDTMTIYPPYVIERTSRGERSYDIFSRLLMDRIVFLGTPIDDNVANIIIAQLLFLQAEDPEKDIYMYIN